MGNKYYAVAKGRTPGIYYTWDDCYAQTYRFSGAQYKSFSTLTDAQQYMTSKSINDLIADVDKLSTLDQPSNNSLTISKSVIDIYIDGACEANGTSYAKGGYGVWISDNNPLNVSAPLIGPKQSNNRAEAQALLVALLIASDGRRFDIYTDSMYVVNNVQTLKSGESTISTNIDQWTYIGRLLNDRPSVTVKYIKGHSGVYGNEEADKLANNGVQLHSC